MTTIMPSNIVERQGSAKDYTTGRIGVVIETDSRGGGRARVLWLREKSGVRIKVRTWVAFSTLLKLSSFECGDWIVRYPSSGPFKLEYIHKEYNGPEDPRIGYTNVAEDLITVLKPE